jgi:hypothetical protein
LSVRTNGRALILVILIRIVILIKADAGKQERFG